MNVQENLISDRYMHAHIYSMPVAGVVLFDKVILTCDIIANCRFDLSPLGYLMSGFIIGWKGGKRVTLSHILI